MTNLVPEDDIPKNEQIGMSKDEWDWLNSGPLGPYCEMAEMSEVMGDYGDREAFRYQLEGYGEEGIIIPMMDKGIALRVWNKVLGIGGSMQREEWGVFVLVDQSKFGELDGERLLARLLREKDAVYDYYDNEDEGPSDWVTVGIEDNKFGTTQDNMIHVSELFTKLFDDSEGSGESNLISALGDVYPDVF